MDDFGGYQERMVVGYVECVVQQSIGPAEVARSKVDRRANTKLCLGYVGHCHRMMEVGDPKSCSSGHLSGHWGSPRFGCTEAMWFEGRCHDRDTVGLKLGGRQLIGERRAG